MVSRLSVASAFLVLSALPWCGCSGDDSPGTADAATQGDGTSSACTRRILESHVTNARDLGDHPLSGGHLVACKKILRGGDLCGLSGDGCDELARLGVKTVIDLRMADVQQAQPAASCATSQATTVSAVMPKLLPDTPENYLALMTEKSAITAAFAALGEAQSYPVYLHCVIGRDRASFVTALILLALGAERQTVIDEFNLSAEAGVAVKQPCIEAVLDEIESQGGIETYLTSVGVTATQLETLRAEARVK